jgi:hypothetical protein
MSTARPIVSSVKGIIGFAILLAIVAFVLGRSRDAWFARRIGQEVRPYPAPPALPPTPTAEDPVVLLEKLQRLREAGALTDIEFESEKARILRG